MPCSLHLTKLTRKHFEFGFESRPCERERHGLVDRTRGSYDVALVALTQTHCLAAVAPNHLREVLVANLCRKQALSISTHRNGASKASLIIQVPKHVLEMAFVRAELSPGKICQVPLSYT